MSDTATKAKAHIRRCCTCGVTKPLQDFSKNRTKSLGYDYRCKSCHSLNEQKRRLDNPEKTREVNRRSHRNNSHRWGEMWANYQRKYCLQYPERHRANALLNYYVGTGKIKPPSICSRCGAEDSLDAHHPDYGKPLEVTWLCRVCHKKEQRRLENVCF